MATDTSQQPSEYDSTTFSTSSDELRAAKLREFARRHGEPEPPWGGTYSGSETSKRRRMPWR